MSSGLVLLDNEAVQALVGRHHRKHAQAVDLVEAATRRNLREPGRHRLVVPATVRVEAGWDRRAPGAATINRLRAVDHVLDTPTANRAAAIRSALGVAVADAHLGVCLAETDAPATVVTSDTDDIGRIARHLGRHVTIVRL